MKCVNRAAVIIRPKQPFVDWINTTPELEMQDEPLSLEYFRDDCTAILVPDVDGLDDVHYYLDPLKPALFEMQLADWYTHPKAWPKKRDAKTFDQWFGLEVHSMVWDLVHEPLVEVEQAWRILDLLEEVEDDREALATWLEFLEDALEFPFFAEVQETYMLGPLRQGDRVRAASLAGSDPLYGVLVEVQRGEERYQFPLCNLAVLEEEEENCQLVEDYGVWFRSR